MKHASKCFAALASLAFASQAHAQAAGNIGFICPELNASTGQLEVRVSNSCLTGGSRIVSQDLMLEVDQQHALINVTGGFEVSPGTLVGNAYCAAPEVVPLQASEVEARRYTVLYEGEYLGMADFLSDEDQPGCLNISELTASAAGRDILRLSFAEWDDDPVDGWRDWRGSDPLSLLSPILATHPEALEGRPSVSIEMEKLNWRGMQNVVSGAPSELIGVWITRHGFADDAVSGDRYFAAVIFDDEGWRIDWLWGQTMCARGDQAGQWTTARCP